MRMNNFMSLLNMHFFFYCLMDKHLSCECKINISYNSLKQSQVLLPYWNILLPVSPLVTEISYQHPLTTKYWYWHQLNQMRQSVICTDEAKRQCVAGPYFGLKTSSQRRSGMVDDHEHVSLYRHVQRNLGFSVLHLKIPAKRVETVRQPNKTVQALLVWVHVCGNSLHPVIFLRCSEDPLVAHVHLAEWPTPVALLVEEWHGRHDDGADDNGLAVRDDGLLCHHVAHVLDIPWI